MILRIILAVLSVILASCTVVRTETADNAPRTVPMPRVTSDRPVIGLALGGGGSRGFAHVGVIKALEEAGIVADVVAGSSSGAIVAALYASGYEARALENIALELEEGALLDFTLFGRGWVQGVALQDFINRTVHERPLEKLARPLAVVATRARDGAMAVFNQGNTGLAVRASASVPNLFIPPVIRGEEYVDGGFTSPVPVSVARSMGADIVIAVDVSWFAHARHNGAPIGANRSARGGMLERELELADVVIEPRTLRARMLDFGYKLQNIAAGYEAGRAALPRLRELIADARGRKAIARGSESASEPIPE
jgi:NTE family protein